MARLLTSEKTAPPLGIGQARPISVGGTGANNAQQAAQNLQFISQTLVNQPSGCPNLGLDGKLSASLFPVVLLNKPNPQITGPLTTGIGTTTTYTVTNYDSGIVYNLISDSGTASQTGNTITWTAPVTPKITGFILNGVDVIVNVGYGDLTITGPSSINENTPVIYTIANFNSNIAYNVQAILGTVTVSGDQIQYTAPATNGIVALYAGFTVNATEVSIKINPAPLPIVSGPVTLALGQVGTYVITNYVVGGTYQVQAAEGTIAINLANITFTAPNAVGTYRFTVNGLMVAVNVILPSVITPIITSPVQGTLNLGPDVVITASSFAMSVGTDTQQSASWELATNLSFLNVVQASLNDPVNLTSWTVKNLTTNSTYYLRVQYTGNNSEVSAWSVPVTFVTKNNYVPTTITGQVSATVGSNFGYNTAMDSAGLTLAVSAPTSNLVNIYVYSNSAWILFQTLTAPTGVTNYGMGVNLNSLGNTLVVGAPDSLTAYVYQLQNNVWTQTATIVSPAASGKFGYSVAINDSANMLFIGDYALANVYVYTFDGTNWVLSQTITFATGSNFGYSFAINGSGNLLAVGAYLSNQVALYQYGGQSFNLTQTINAPTGISFFGVCIELSRETFTLLIGASTSQTVYIYTSTTGAVWTLYQTITSPAPTATGYFGRSAAINGQGGVFMVGAYGTGSAYLYQLSSTQYTLAQTFTSTLAPQLGFSTVLTNNGAKAVVFDNTAAIGLTLS